MLLQARPWQGGTYPAFVDILTTDGGQPDSQSALGPKHSRAPIYDSNNPISRLHNSFWASASRLRRSWTAGTSLSQDKPVRNIEMEDKPRATIFRSGLNFDQRFDYAIAIASDHIKGLFGLLDFKPMRYHKVNID
jgi:hypothetical protein